MILVALLFAACGTSTAGDQSVPGRSTTSTTALHPRTSASPSTTHPASTAVTHHRPHRRPSTVPADVPMPNPALTPGAIQSSDTTAICTPGWASAHREVSSATENAVAAEYGLSSHEGYEIDHLIPLELGGSNSRLNLWPEPYQSPYGAIQKDGLEDWLHEQVCDSGLPLATAQQEIARNWYATWVAAGRPLPSWFGYSNAPGGGSDGDSGPGASAPPTTEPPSSGAWCTASASPSSDGYAGDYDVFVHSNEPDAKATASDANDSWSHETDASGYADIYLWHTSPGETITVRVGNASCTTSA